MSDTDEEVNAMVALSYGGSSSYLAVGVTSGKLVILDLATMEPCFIEEDFVGSETVFLSHRKSDDNPCG